MGRVETFDHTADLGLRVWGVDLSDLFETAAAGLFDVIVANRAEVQPLEEESVELAAETLDDLFMAWLNELIFRSETRHRLYGRFRATIIEDTSGGCRLNATITGEPIDRDRHVLDHEVKAATGHGLFVRPGEGGWQAEVVVDI